MKVVLKIFFLTLSNTNTNLNNHFINLIDDKQLLYDSIYSLKSVKFKILKLILKSTWLKTLSNLPNQLLVPIYNLFPRKIVAFNYLLIIKVLIT